MGIQRLQPVKTGVYPSRLGRAYFAIGSSQVSTYYTVVDIAGKGVVNRISCFNGYNMAYSKIKITIDGTVTEYQPPTTALVLTARDSSSIMDFIANLGFNTSLKVEVLQTYGATNSLECGVEYALL